MKIRGETADEIVTELLPLIEKERQRRQDVYGDLAPWLYDLLPLFKLTHTAGPQRCLRCEERIPPQELHFLCPGSRQFPGSRVCTRRACLGIKPDLRLASVDGVLQE